MEYTGFLRHFSDLSDTTKYAGIDFFMKFNQPPTNDTFCRAARFEGFHLHMGSPWEKVQEEDGKVCYVAGCYCHVWYRPTTVGYLHSTLAHRKIDSLASYHSNRPAIIIIMT